MSVRSHVTWTLVAFAGVLLAGCQEAPEPTARLEAPPIEETPSEGTPSEGTPAEEAHEPAPSAPVAAGEARVFGTAPDASLPVTRLGEIVADPQRYRDQVVRTEGEIAQVCQRMGCWMELREGEEGPSVRVPMAGHSFFLPRDSAGRRATMQGRVALTELSPEARAHLESEGASATASALSIEATGVVID